MFQYLEIFKRINLDLVTTRTVSEKIERPEENPVALLVLYKPESTLAATCSSHGNVFNFHDEYIHATMSTLNKYAKDSIPE